MGIDFSHCDAHWAYSGFNRFRSRVAAAIGIDWNRVITDQDYAQRFADNEDPIIPLLNHSDCDGELTPDECRAVAPRLREIVAPWPDDHDKNQALELAEGMDEAAKANEPLEFR